MPIKVTKTTTRQEASTPFFKVRTDLANYIVTTYVDTGLILSWNRVEDATGLLSIQTVTVFKDQESKDIYDRDQETVLIREAMNAHNVEFNIEHTIEIETI